MTLCKMFIVFLPRNLWLEINDGNIWHDRLCTKTYTIDMTDNTIGGIIIN